MSDYIINNDCTYTISSDINDITDSIREIKEELEIKSAEVYDNYEIENIKNNVIPAGQVIFIENISKNKYEDCKYYGIKVGNGKSTISELEYIIEPEKYIKKLSEQDENKMINMIYDCFEREDIGKLLDKFRFFIIGIFIVILCYLI